MTEDQTRRQFAAAVIALGGGVLAGPPAIAQVASRATTPHAHAAPPARAPAKAAPTAERPADVPHAHAHMHGGASELRPVAEALAQSAEAGFAYALKQISAGNPVLLDCARTAAAVAPVAQAVAKLTTVNTPRFAALIDVAVGITHDCEAAISKVAAYHPPIAALLNGCRTFLRVAIAAHPLPANLALIGGSFALTDHQGRAVSSQSMDGKPYVLVFGYTRCPDYCPTVLALLSNLLDRLGKDRALPVFFVSLDANDGTDKLADYLTAFHPAVRGLTGSRQAIDDTVRAFRAYYEILPRPPADYVIDHTMTIYLMRGPRCVGLSSLDEAESTQLDKLRSLVGG